MKQAMLLLGFWWILGSLPAADNPVMPGSASRPESTGPQAANSKAESYAEEAIELVKKQRPAGGLQIEIEGETALKPDDFRMGEMAPDSIVLVNLISGEIVQEQALVIFSGKRPAIIRFSSQKSFFPEGKPDRAELRRIHEELDSFFVAAMDVTRGSDRFYPYLPDDIRSLFKHSDRKFRMFMPLRAVNPTSFDTEGLKAKLSDEEVRRFAALQLNSIVQQAMLLLGGVDLKAIAQANSQRPQALESNPREYIRSLEKSVAENERLLKGAGLFNSERLRKASRYLKLMIGQGYVIKEVRKSDPCPCFLAAPSTETLYVTSLTNLMLHFTRTGGGIRVACAAVP